MKKNLSTLAAVFMAATFTMAAEYIPNVTKLTDKWIDTEEKLTYHGWPTMAFLQDGRLAVVGSGHRTAHVDPFGRVYLYLSEDLGVTWSKPVVLSKGPLDDRDAGIIQLPDGTILVNYFTSLAFCGNWADATKLNNSWREAESHITLDQCNRELGQFMLRSKDGAKTWEAKWACPVGNVHGPCLLKDGTLLWIGKAVNYKRMMVESRYDRDVVVMRSKDGGRNWEQISAIPRVPGQDQINWHEMYQIQTQDGTIICHIRNEGVPAAEGGSGTWQCESKDNGITWTVPHKLCYGICNHLVNLPDGRVMMTYGYRKAPFGVRFRISADNGTTWSAEGILCDDGNNGDLGYPSTVVLPDGTLATAWYQYRADKGLALFRCLHWKLD